MAPFGVSPSAEGDSDEVGVRGSLTAVSSAAPRRAVFLDRDGVLIESIVRDGNPIAASAADEVGIIAGVPEACAELSEQGYLLVMVTNQPDIARGKVSRR